MVTLKNGRLVEETTASQHLLEVNNRNPSSLSGSKAIESPAHRCTIGPLLTNTKCPNRPTPLLFFQGGGGPVALNGRANEIQMSLCSIRRHVRYTASAGRRRPVLG